jgi:hypothetical protein
MKACQAASLDEVMDRVTRADILLDFGPFLKLSPEGHALLRGLLARDPAQRLTAEVNTFCLLSKQTSICSHLEKLVWCFALEWLCALSTYPRA